MLLEPLRRLANIQEYRGTSLIRNAPLLGPYRRPLLRVLGGFLGGGRFLMSEVPLWVYMASGVAHSLK